MILHYFTAAAVSAALFVVLGFNLVVDLAHSPIKCRFFVKMLVALVGRSFPVDGLRMCALDGTLAGYCWVRALRPWVIEECIERLIT